MVEALIAGLVAGIATAIATRPRTPAAAGGAAPPSPVPPEPSKGAPDKAPPKEPAKPAPSSDKPAPAPASSTAALPRAPLVPKAGSPGAAARIRALKPLLSKYWTELTGDPNPMPPQALELAVSQAGLESSYGGGWTDKTSKGQGDMRGSNNLGARQCGRFDTGGPSWRCVPYGDSMPMPDGSQKPIEASFRYYQAGEGRSAEENGAYYFLRDLVKQWPTAPELRTGDALMYSLILYRKGYFGGFNVKAPERARMKGTLDTLVALGVPKRNVDPEQVAARVASYAKAIGMRLPEVSAALGHDKVYAFVPADVLASGAPAHLMS